MYHSKIRLGHHNIVCACCCLHQAWDGSSSNGQYDSLLTCMEAARARELPMSLERNLVMLHTMKPHYDPVKDGEGELQAVWLQESGLMLITTYDIVTEMQAVPGHPAFAGRTA
jgi:hypothetical protein